MALDPILHHGVPCRTFEEAIGELIERRRTRLAMTKWPAQRRNLEREIKRLESLLHEHQA